MRNISSVFRVVLMKQFSTHLLLLTDLTSVLEGKNKYGFAINAYLLTDACKTIVLSNHSENCRDYILRC